MEKKLQRSRKKRVLAGIAGGLGEYLDIDPVIVRVVFVLITIFHGFGLIVYIILWIVIPEEPFDMSFTDKDDKFSEDFGKSFSDGINAGAKSVFDEATKAAEQVNLGAKSNNGRIIVGAILILIGLLFLSEKLFPFLDFEFVFAIGIILLGLSLLFNFFNKSEKSS